MARRTVETVPGRILVFYLNGPLRTLIYNEHDIWDKKMAKRCLHPPAFEFEVVYRAGENNQPGEALSQLPATRIDESRLKDDVLVLTITEAR